MVIPGRVTERAFLRYSVIDNGCHISGYSVASHGYAQIGWKADGKMHGTTAHRAAWTHVHGQIPGGMTVDHKCGNRTCVNVDHLRLLSNFNNARRTSGRDWPLGQCVKGHDDSHLRRNSRGRLECRICYLDWNRTYREKKRERRL